MAVSVAVSVVFVVVGARVPFGAVDTAFVATNC